MYIVAEITKANQIKRKKKQTNKQYNENAIAKNNAKVPRKLK